MFWFWAIVSDYSKIILVKEDSKKVWRALGTGFKFTLSKLFLTYPLYLLLIILPVAVSLLYLWIDSVIGMKDNAGMLIMILIQQLLVWFRFFAKIWLITAEYEFFNEYYSVRTQPLQTQEMLLDESL